MMEKYKNTLKTKSADIAIIGGGASGLAAALICRRKLLKEKRQAEIIVLERHGKPGRKLLATGNGTCNISNIDATSQNSAKYYYGNNPDFVREVLKKYDVSFTVEFFEHLGIETEVEGSGKIYPVCRQSAAVLNALEYEMSSKEIKLITNFDVTKIKKEKNFIITGIETTSQDDKHSKDVCHIEAEKLIIATGGKAFPSLSSDGSGYLLAESLGHSITPLFPGITQINTTPDINIKLKGLRWNAALSLGSRKEYGEILFTDYGLSGPAALQISRHINEIEKKSPVAAVDFFPNLTNRELAEILKKRTNLLSQMPLDRILTGLLPLKAALEITQKAFKNPSGRKIGSITIDEISGLILLSKNYRFNITGTKGFEKAQITAGGVSCGEIDFNTCESLICRDLYFCGEVLDVDGDCGGFNLQFAWSSAFLAGESAAKSL